MRATVRMGINTRIFAVLITAILAASVLSTLVGYKIFHDAMEKTFQENIRLTARHFAASATISLLFNDPKIALEVARSIVQSSYIVGVKVENSRGKSFIEVGKTSKHSVSIPLIVGNDEESMVFFPQNQRMVGIITIYYTLSPLRHVLGSMFVRIVVVVLIISAVVLVVAYYSISRAILNPIWELIKAVREVSGGSTHVELGRSSVPEIDELRTAFVEMVNSIREHQQLLKESYENLARQKAMAEIGKFSFTVAHEVKNPLGIIKGSIDLLRKPEVDSSTREQLLDYIEEEVKRIDRLIKNFLKLAKTSKPELNKVDIPLFLQSLASKLAIEHNHVKIEVDSCEEHFEVLTDPQKLNRILSNLVINAIEAGATKIKLSFLRQKEEWKIVVEDNGPGISEEDISKIFQPFYTTKSSGTGLGLTVVSQEVYILGGKIALESEPGKGCRFIITFPTEGTHGSDTGSG